MQEYIQRAEFLVDKCFITICDYITQREKVAVFGVRDKHVL